MTSYSQDLRQRVLDTVQRREGSLRQIARRFLVSVSFVTRLLRTHRNTGSLEPKPHGGGNPPVLTPEDLERLRELIRQQPDATLEESRHGLRHRAEAGGCRGGGEEGGEFWGGLGGIDPGRLVFGDECGANTAMTRTHGRA